MKVEKEKGKNQRRVWSHWSPRTRVLVKEGAARRPDPVKAGSVHWVK